MKLKFLPIYSRISKKPFHISLITNLVIGVLTLLCHFLVSLYHRLLHCLVFKVQSFYIDFKLKQVCVQFAFSSTSSRTSVRKTEKKCEMCVKLFELVEMRRIELLTPLLARQVLSQLSYTPKFS